MFPSPYGAWVSSGGLYAPPLPGSFPSPYGAWVSSIIPPFIQSDIIVFVSVPLRGMGFINFDLSEPVLRVCFCPLTGHGFHRNSKTGEYQSQKSFRPLTGHGFHLHLRVEPNKSLDGFRPLTGHGFHRQKCICLLQHQNALLNKVPHVVLSYCSNRRIYLLRL